jgi:hypothetical protein
MGFKVKEGYDADPHKILRALLNGTQSIEKKGFVCIGLVFKRPNRCPVKQQSAFYADQSNSNYCYVHLSREL